MKNLYLFRHGDAKEGKADSDYFRKLTEKGELENSLMAEEIARSGFHPDLIFTSGASRAVSTASIIADRCSYPPENIIIDDMFYYLENAANLFPFLNKIPDEISSILIVGHNPLLSDFVLYICGLTSKIDMKKSSAIRIGFASERWSTLTPGSGKIISYRVLSDGTVKNLNPDN